MIKMALGNLNLLRPSTAIIDKQIIATPTINSPKKLTESSKSVSVDHPDNTVSLYYTLDGAEPTLQSKMYTTPFNCDSSTIIKAKAFIKKRHE